ncbi:hypothetical protein L596_008929 [Steinernema carpocapsae]|uniref:Uncharacterized protein n=1 Tax=Steinernema carpocapsae TaxID=34508 RepID=A0A4U5PDW2_STECR|nr:hypothetical protein L596_008929 [Steinernema carpocapsae]
MASKVLFAVALVALASLASTQTCDCDWQFKRLKAANNDIFHLLNRLASTKTEISGCSFQEAHGLADKLLVEIIGKVSGYAGIEIPPLPERPFTLACSGLQPTAQQFKDFAAALDLVFADYSLCGCTICSKDGFERFLIEYEVLLIDLRTGSN